MTRTPSRVRQNTRGSPVMAAAAGGLWASGLGLVIIAAVTLLGWPGAVQAGAGGLAALRFAGWLWLVAQHAALALPQGSFGLAPLGLTALQAYLVFLAGRWTVRRAGARGLPSHTLAACALAATHGLVAAVVAALTVSETVRPQMWQAGAAATALGAVAGGVGVLDGSGALRRLWHRVPGWVRTLLAASGSGVATLLAGGAVLAGTSLVLNAARARAMFDVLRPDAPGSLALLLLCVAFLPNAVVWAAAYAAGPGFAVGVATSITPLGADVGVLPAFPLLAAVPPEGAGSAATYLAFGVPVVAGVVTGLCLRRRARSGLETVAAGLGAGLAAGAAAGATAGAAVGALTWLSAGPAAGGR
ncbi:MAG: cell division protein PerM, partial [Streptomycetales bacterium]